MLILTRRINESLVIGDDVTVTILGVKGNQVRIGVDAPRNVSVHRGELAHKMTRHPLCARMIRRQIAAQAPFNRPSAGISFPKVAMVELDLHH